MNRDEWLIVGMKLIGVYFAILGVSVLVVDVLSLAIQAIGEVGNPTLFFTAGRAVSFLSAMQPLAYLAGAFVLTRKTEWCLRLITPVPTARGFPMEPGQPADHE